MWAAGGDRYLQAIALSRALQQLQPVGREPFADWRIVERFRPQIQLKSGCGRSTTSLLTVKHRPNSNPGTAARPLHLAAPPIRPNCFDQKARVCGVRAPADGGEAPGVPAARRSAPAGRERVARATARTTGSPEGLLITSRSPSSRRTSTDRGWLPPARADAARPADAAHHNGINSKINAVQPSSPRTMRDSQTRSMNGDGCSPARQSALPSADVESIAIGPALIERRRPPADRHGPGQVTVGAPGRSAPVPYGRGAGLVEQSAHILLHIADGGLAGGRSSCSSTLRHQLQNTGLPRREAGPRVLGQRFGLGQRADFSDLLGHLAHVRVGELALAGAVAAAEPHCERAPRVRRDQRAGCSHPPPPGNPACDLRSCLWR